MFANRLEMFTVLYFALYVGSNFYYQSLQPFTSAYYWKERKNTWLEKERKDVAHISWISTKIFQASCCETMLQTCKGYKWLCHTIHYIFKTFIGKFIFETRILSNTMFPSNMLHFISIHVTRTPLDVF